MKLKREVKKKWVKALRSGEYKQTRGVLRRVRGGFCCLGVLCDILKTKSDKWEKSPFNEKTMLFTHQGSTYASRVPTKLRLEIGLSIENESELIDMNDYGCDFKKIAKCIEEKL